MGEHLLCTYPGLYGVPYIAGTLAKPVQLYAVIQLDEVGNVVNPVQTPLLIAPDDVPAHPYKVAMEVASLAPNAEVTIYPWKDSQSHIDEVVEHARRFLKAHEAIIA